ncbi:MAG: prepilin-type N-terminal cleavage/methylation domain-containing protein [Fimbriimonadaceae bacterium]|nr:prepilin-type N-terminal cleavage/methylation domain-containing protein [Fimbriimonadaceae bacterium]QYK58607.1 MAG: prepilin-type N-terminal cleavage/methylation domain-containing protein [Fimbriimonadaceae bacterium]
MRRAFTLIELLVVIAIIAILAAILFPVFAQAKTSAKVTASTSGMKQVALGFHIYSGDYDDTAVYHYGDTPQGRVDYTQNTTWVADILPYVKNRSIFFDPTLPEPKGDNRDLYFDPFYNDWYAWTWVTHFSVNVDGYSVNLGGSSCETLAPNVERGSKIIGAFADPAKRLAVTPIRYADLPFAWMRFYAYEAAWPRIDRYAAGWDWKQLVWDARRQYPNARLVGGFADGHAAKFGREKFVGRFADASQSEARNYREWCAKMTEKDLWDFWGRGWTND